MNQIADGTGTGNLAKVNSRNRLETLAISEPRVADISKTFGRAFILASDFISLTTTGSFNGILYIKNTSSDYDLFIDKLRVCSSASAFLQCRIINNPTTGTLISDANAADQLSSKIGSSQTFLGLAYAASADGKTVTDGANMSQFINMSPGHTIQEYDGSIVIPNGQAIALTIKPSASTTVCAEVQCWFE